MADRQLLFSTPMIQALQAGRKTQTRRIHHTQEPEFRRTCDNGCDGRLASMCILPATTCGRRRVTPTRYGVSDRLWVREAWAPLDALTHNDPGVRALIDRGFYRADESTVDGEISRWRPGIHMPRWASRLTLIVTDVRVERLQDISETDAIAEGVESDPETNAFWGVEGAGLDGSTRLYATAALAFRDLWDGLNDARGFGWAANPWVCAVTFTVHRCNIDSMDGDHG